MYSIKMVLYEQIVLPPRSTISSYKFEWRSKNDNYCRILIIKIVENVQYPYRFSKDIDVAYANGNIWRFFANDTQK